MKDRNLTDAHYCASEMERVAKDAFPDYSRTLLIEGANHIKAMIFEATKKTKKSAP